jgi:hypothetical protein
VQADETHVRGACTLANLRQLEEKLMGHIVAAGKRPLGWEQVYKTTGAAQQVPGAIVRVYDTGTDVGTDSRVPLLLNVTSAGHDAIVGDSARYYLNSCCPAVHDHKLCELGSLSNRTGIPVHEPCFWTDILSFDMGEHTLTPQQQKHLLGGSTSMWTDAYCATNECGAWPGVTPMAGWMAESPKHDAAFHDSLLASIFPAAAVSVRSPHRTLPCTCDGLFSS